MASTLQVPGHQEQVTFWIRGLLTIAWADGDFNGEEQACIIHLTQTDMDPSLAIAQFQPITPQELAEGLGKDGPMVENFVRMAVMVALADGVYTVPEDQLIQQFCEALGWQNDLLGSLRTTLYDQSAPTPPTSATPIHPADPPHPSLDVLKPVRDWLDEADIHDPRLAHFLCKLIPSQCPFERDITLFGKKIVHIPPLCKLNPLYEQLVSIRFRALSYLADDCGEDITPYC